MTLFCSLSSSPAEKGAYRRTGGANLTSELWSLLWGAAASTEYRARLCAVEWACDLFDFSDVAARRVCVSLFDDKVTAVRSAAARGLRPPPRTSTKTASADESVTVDLQQASRHPSFESFVLGALRDDAVPAIARGKGSAPASLQELPPVAFARALDFALECRNEHSGHGTNSSSDSSSSHSIANVKEAKQDVDIENEEAVTVFLSLIETTLMSAPSATDGQHGQAQMVLLHRSAAVALQKLAAGSPTKTGEALAGIDQDEAGRQASPRLPPVAGVAAKLASRGPWLQQWLGHESSTEIREAFAETTGAAAAFMDADTELVTLLRALGHKLKVRKDLQLTHHSKLLLCRRRYQTLSQDVLFVV